jgi:WD40 repeat protein
MSEPEPRESPYFGLQYFDEQDGEYFFGRETARDTIITNLRAARLTLLHAGSGVGKSSLLRAGAAGRLRKLADDTMARRKTVRSIPVVFTGWKDDPCGDLADAVRAAVGPYLAGRPAPEPTEGHLDEDIQAAAKAVNASLFIMLDQFEEYFIYRAYEPVPERFADELARCVNRTDLRANFLISIREDAYASLGDLFKGRIPNVYGNFLNIDYLDRPAAEQAIREPLKVYNSQHESQQMELQDKLVEAVLARVPAPGGDGARSGLAATGDASADGDHRIDTPLLQLVMERVWEAERAAKSNKLRLATLDKLGGVKKIADDHLEKALGSLNRIDRDIAIDLFDYLVTASGGKIAISVPDLAIRTRHSEGEIREVLKKLDGERIVRAVPAAPGQDAERFRRYEIFHDVLAPTINRVIEARDLQRRARRRNRFLIFTIYILVIITTLAGLFAFETLKAKNETSLAESHQLTAAGDLNLGTDPELSTLLALQALHTAYTRQAEDTLRTALPEMQGIRTLRNGSLVSSAVFDPADNDLVASTDLTGRASIWDVRTGRQLVRTSVGGSAGSANAVAFNPAGTEVAVGYEDGDIALFDVATGKSLALVADGAAPINDVQFLGDTGTLAIASQQNLALWQPNEGITTLLSVPALRIGVNPRRPREFAVVSSAGVVIVNRGGSPVRSLATPGPGITVNDAEFSPDGGKVVAADSNGKVYVYDLSRRNAPPAVLDAGELSADSAAFSPDGSQVVASYSSGTARVWDLATGLQETVLAGGASEAYTARFDATGSEVVTADKDGTIRIWYTRPRELRTAFTIPAGGRTPPPVVGAYYIAGRIAVYDKRGYLRVFTADGRQQAVLPAGAALAAAGWDSTGTRALTATANGTITLWQAAGTGYVKVPGLSPLQVDALGDTRMSPDGSIFADVAGGSTVELRDADTGAIVQTLQASSQVNVVAVSPGSAQVVGGDDYGQVEVWQDWVSQPKLLGSPTAPIVSIEYDQRGDAFAAVSASGTVTVWDARDGQPRTSISACSSPETAWFSPDGTKLAVACEDGTIRVFGTSSAQLLTELQATRTGAVTDAAFSPDGKSVVAGVDAGNTGYVQVWNAELSTSSLTVQEQMAEARVTQQLTQAQVQHYLNDAGG